MNWMDKQTVVYHTKEFYSEIKGWNIDTCKNTNECQDYCAK